MHWAACKDGLHQELDKVYEELDEKDEALTAETQRRETVELELENLHAQRAEMEQQLANAQQVTRDASSLLTHLDNEADQLTAKVISGEISEEQSNAMEEELIRAQAKKLAATKMEERWGQQLTEAFWIVKAMGTCCSKDDADKLEAVESKDVVPTAPETPVVEETSGNSWRTETNEQGAHVEDSESAPAPRDGEFIIVLDKTNGERLGMDDGRTLAVDAITGGLIQKWNEEHPDKALKPKDRIVEVNGLRGDVLQLVDECKKPKAVTSTVGPSAAYHGVTTFVRGIGGCGGWRRDLWVCFVERMELG
eukprot:g29480.t1